MAELPSATSSRKSSTSNGTMESLQAKSFYLHILTHVKGFKIYSKRKKKGKENFHKRYFIIKHET